MPSAIGYDAANDEIATRAKNFLRNLPILKISELPADSRLCLICHEPYTAKTELPVRLPCSHIVGIACISTWCSPSKRGKNSCPMCRHEFFSSMSLQRQHLISSPAQRPQPSNPSNENTALRLRELCLYNRIRRANPALPAPEPFLWEEPLFEELQRLGAFSAPYVGDDARGVGGERAMWDVLRTRRMFFHLADRTAGTGWFSVGQTWRDRFYYFRRFEHSFVDNTSSS